MPAGSALSRPPTACRSEHRRVCPFQVVEQAQRLSAFKHGSHPEAQATDTGRPAAAKPDAAQGLPQTQATAGNRSVLSVDFPPLQMMDAATSPFSEAGANLKSPLAQAKELLSKVMALFAKLSAPAAVACSVTALVGRG